MSWYLAPVGAALILYGSGDYALRTLRGSVQPNPVTWILWTLAPSVAFAAQVAHHAGPASLTTLSAGLGPLLVTLCALTRRGFRPSRPLPTELCCAALSLAALAGWWATADPDAALVLSIVADGCAAFPTVVKCHRAPETEDKAVYALTGLSAALTLLSLPTWTFPAAGFSCYLLALCGTVLGLLLRRTGPDAVNSGTRAVLRPDPT